MKLTAFFILAGLLQVHASAFSQRVHIDQEQAELPAIMQAIEQQTGYHFLYDQKDIRTLPAQDVHLQQASLQQALRTIFAETPLHYKIVNNTIVLRRDPSEPTLNRHQPGEIQGRVLDEQGQGLPGVTIRVKGQNRSTSTDGNGDFSLRFTGEYPVLEFSYLGYKTQELQTSNADLQVVMTPDPGNLDEVVVIGYGTTTQRLNTGSVSSVNSEILSRQPVVDPLSALQGRVPGLMVTSNSGMPGASFKVRIRGEGSLQAGNDPLFIVDGMPFNSSPLNQFNGGNGGQNPLNSINPNDIERIDVLKDADATSIYGSRGANGVILITTKQGIAGRTSVNFNLSTGWNETARSLDMLSTAQYLELRKEAYQNDEESPTPDNGIDLLEWDPQAGTNWQEYLMGHSAPMSEARISFSGGNDQTRFLLSGNYTRQGNVMPDDFVYQRGATHLSVQHNALNGRLQMNASVNYSADKNNSLSSDIAQFYNLSPNYPIYDEQGALYWFGTTQNPMAYLERSYQSNTRSLTGNAKVTYQILEDFNFVTSLGYSEMHMDQVQTLPKAAFNPANYSSSIGQYGFSDMQSYIIEPQLDYVLERGKSKFTFLLGATLQQTVLEGHNLYGTSYTSDSQLENMQNAAELTVRGFNYSDYRYASAFGRIKYNLDDKYLANATFRRDGSSRFGPGRKYGNFGSLGLAWIFSNEDWLKGNSILSFGKLRGSYGSTGNDQIGDYQYLDTWGSSGFPFQNINGLYPSRVYNPDFGWEDNRKMEVAVELGFLQDRLFLNTQYYNNRSGNQLVEIALSPQSGFSSYLGNSPASVENSGWEFELNGLPVQTEDFSWNAAFNISFPKNKLRAYPDLENTGDAAKYVIGESIRIVKGFDFTGVDPQTGLAQYRDVDGDGALTEPEDYVIMGDLLPKFFGGLNNDLNYKNLGLSFFFQFVKQDGPMINYGPYASPYGSRVNQDLSALDRWRQPGDITDIPRATTTSTNEAYTNFRDYYRYSSAVWDDASFIRLKNVALSYDLSTLVKPYKIQSLRIFAQGQNLLTFSSYRGMDPEIQGFDRSVVSPVNPFGAVRAPAMPAMRTYTFGVQIGL